MTSVELEVVGGGNVDSEESSDEDSEGSDTEEIVDEILKGCYVWAPFNRRKYPAQVVSLAFVRKDLQRQLTTRKAGQVCVRWVG